MTEETSTFDERLLAALGDSFLALLRVAERTELAASAARFDVPAGTVIYRDADKPRLALVLEGLLRVFLTSAEGRQLTVRYARPGDFLGVAVTVGGPVDVSVQAVTDATVAMIEPARLEVVARHRPDVGWAVAEEVSRRLYEALREMAGSAFWPLRDRVIRHLLDLAAQAQADGSRRAAVSQQELADAVGSVREVVARYLAEFRDRGLIETDRDGITICDPAALHRELSAVI
jgi:CRP/FNR family transcriptional regulator